MRRPLPLSSAATRRGLALTLAIAAMALPGCKPASEPAPADPAPAEPAPAPAEPTPAPAEPAPAAKDAPLAEGWTRLDLSTLPGGLTGTVDVPSGITATTKVDQTHDPDGLQVDITTVQIGPRGAGVALAPLAQRPPRFASADAMARFHGRFEVLATREITPDHWAITQRWRPGECMVHGWSGPAGLTCDVFKTGCDDVAKWVDVCASVKPGSAPNTIGATPASAFPKLPVEAAQVAMTVARAIARDDKAMLRSAIGPAGLTLAGKPLDPHAFDARLKGKSVFEAVAPGYAAVVGGAHSHAFNDDGGGVGEAEARIFFDTGYGEQPYFTVANVGDAWRLTGFGVFDHGEP